MANVRIDQYPKKNSPASTDWLLLQDMSDKDVNGIGKYKRVSPNSVGANTAVGSYTYAQLLALATASELQVGRQYLIEDATSAEFNLLVEAVKANQIGCDAKDPLYPNDVVKYNFASNVITWRWDTVNDISAGEDWRNSNNISIGTGCSNIHISNGCSGDIPNDSTNIVIGKGVAFTFNPSDVITNLEIKDDVTPCDVSNSSIITNSSTKTILLNADGTQRIIYWDSDNVLQNVALNA